MPDPASRSAAVRDWRPYAVAAAIVGIGVALWPAESSLARSAFALSAVMAAGATIVALAMTVQIKRHTARIHTAFANMSQGLCMFDADERLAVTNKTYLDMYRLPANEVKPGITLRKLLEIRKATGSFEVDVEQYLANLKASMEGGKATAVETTSPDGRLISLLSRPMKGGGWVATHEDITERRAAETERDRLQQHEKRRAAIDAAIAAFRDPGA